MKTVLVLGGTSWVGGLVAHEATLRGHEVTCLARGESGRAPGAATFVRADRSQPGAYDEVLDRRWDAVIDLSSDHRQVRSAVEALGGVTSHWTFVSTVSVYADQSGPLTEVSPVLEPLPGEQDPAAHYGEAKVAGEVAVSGHPHHLVVRAGLIGGPGDRSDRLGYYVGRFALAGDGPVLLPDVAAQPLQVVDARDLAGWVVRSFEAGTTGVVHAPGRPTTVGEVIDLSAQVGGFEGERVVMDAPWLLDHGVEQWAGDRSLPLWLPESHHGMVRLDDARALELGLERRPLVQTIADVLADERERGLDRPRRAGLSRRDELELIAAGR